MSHLFAADFAVNVLTKVEERSDEVSTPASAPETSANLNGWNARKTFNHRRRTMRARWSERAAVRDFRKPEQAAR